MAVGAENGRRTGPPPTPRERHRHGVIAAVTVVVLGATSSSSAAASPPPRPTLATFVRYPGLVAALGHPPGSRPHGERHRGPDGRCSGPRVRHPHRRGPVRRAPPPPATTLCTPVSAPFSCRWNTAALPDGAYSLRAAQRITPACATPTAIKPLRSPNPSRCSSRPRRSGPRHHDPEPRLPSTASPASTPCGWNTPRPGPTTGAPSA